MNWQRLLLIRNLDAYCADWDALREIKLNEKTHKMVDFHTSRTQDQLTWAMQHRAVSDITCFCRRWQAALKETYQRLRRFGSSTDGKNGTPDAFVVEVFDQIADLPKACNALFEVSEKGGFDQGSDWFGLLAKTAIPADSRVRFYVLLKNGEVCCVLPLLVGSHGISGLTTFYTTLYRPLIVEGIQPDELAIVLRRVMDDTKASSIRLDAMDPEHPTFALMTNALRQADLLPFGFFNFGNWYLQVVQMTWEDYLKLLPGKLRNTLKRLGKKFAEADGQFKILTGSESDLDEALNAYQAVYSSSWKKPEPFPNFMPEFIRLCARNGSLRMGVAYMDNQPAAAQFWLVSHGKACIYKVAYDEKFSAYSIGSLLTGHLMQHVIEVDGVNEVDYLIGDDTYKKQWMSHRRERWGIVAYNSRTLMGLWGMANETAKRLAKPLWISLRARITQAFPVKM